MPKVSRLGRVDPRETAIRNEIGAGLFGAGMKLNDLANKAGINPSTLYKRMGSYGDLGSMRLSEYWKIQDVLKRYAPEEI